jgi:putative PEP-CTERM system histidine kinase
MPISLLLPLVSSVLCSILAVYALRASTRSFTRRAFATAMVALALEELFVALSALAYVPGDLLRWQRAKIVAMALLPGNWLLFSLSYSRPDYSQYLGRWRWIVTAAFALPLSFAVALNSGVFSGVPRLDNDGRWALGIGWPGQFFYISAIVGFTLVLANLEKTLRGSSGAKRWQIKFLLLGLGGYLAFRIYAATETLLFSSVDSTLEITNSATLLVGCLFIMASLSRSKTFEVDIYLSNTFVYNSIAIMVVGLYLLIVGILSSLLVYATGDQFLSVLPFIVFLAVITLSVLLFSAEARQRAVAIVNRHLRRPAYDYRQIWRAFSDRTTQVTDVRHLCSTIADFVAQTFGAPAVTVWLTSNSSSHVVLGGSTSFSMAQTTDLKTLERAIAALIRGMNGLEWPADFSASQDDLRAQIERDYPNFFRQAEIRYVMPLNAHRRVLGILTVSDCVTKQTLSTQDAELLKTIADQAANALLNRRLSEELLQAKELEAFQTMSAFFVHDLKNLAGGLSLMSCNLQRHLDNPEFRRDALKMLSRTVDKITELCGRMNQWDPNAENERVEVDLNELVSTTVESFDGALKSSLITELKPVPKLSINPDQVQKVLVNLILNADQAVEAVGEIRVVTSRENGAVCLQVQDNGSGIAGDFIEHRLFRPFQTSKKNGLGIGLFQCKQIVEAHGGRIDVESETGKGTTFRVVIPVTAIVDR